MQTMILAAPSHCQRISFNRYDDIRRKRGQVDHAAHVAVVDALSLGNLLQGLRFTRLQHSQPPVPACERELERGRRGDPRAEANALPVWQGDSFAKTVALDPDRDRDGEAAVTRGNHLGLAELTDARLGHAMD